jgi:hypothetical protein
MKVDSVEVDENSVAVITPGKPKALGLFLSDSRSAVHGPESEQQSGQSQQNESSVKGNKHHRIHMSTTRYYYCVLEVCPWVLMTYA